LKRFRSFFYTSLALLSTAVTFWLGYLVALYITASRELAVGLLIACGLLMAPFLFVVLYWDYRCEYQPHRITSDESHALLRVSALLAVLSGPCIVGVFAWRSGSLSLSAFSFAIFGALMAYNLRLLWRLYRVKHERLVAEGLLSGEHKHLTREQRSKLLVVIVMALLVNVSTWTGIYFIFHGAILLGLSLACFGAVLCHPMVRKLRQAVVLE
jgi:hypothetical protein